MKTFKFACRNLLRNKRRTVIAVSSTALAAAVMIVFGCLIDGFIDNFKVNATQMELGDLQIHPPGYSEDASIYLTIENEDQLLKTLDENGFFGSPRIHTAALGATSESSAGIELRGIDQDLESHVTNIHKYLKEGKWIDSSDEKGVVIGKLLAKQLNLGIGSELIVLTQATDGSMANDIFKIRGILKSVSSRIDRGVVFISELSFRKFLLLDKGTHEIAVKVKNSKTASLKDSVDKVKKLATGQDVRSWTELQPVLADILEKAISSVIVMITVTYIALGLLLINSTLMSVFERMKEFGILKALGVKPFQILFLILSEVFLQTFFSALLAIAVGLPLVCFLTVHPLDLGFFSDSIAVAGSAMEPYWYAKITFADIGMPIGFLFLIILPASLYPAFQAAVINPLRAIYYR